MITNLPGKQTGLHLRLDQLEAKLDAILDHLGLEVPEPAYRAEVRAALAAGEDVKAVKIFRQATGASLKEASDYIDSMKMRG